jgi:hypothetical protein
MAAYEEMALRRLGEVVSCPEDQVPQIMWEAQTYSVLAVLAMLERIAEAVETIAQQGPGGA